MTPKEKAKELVDKYLPFGASYDYDVIADKTIMTYDLGASKQCALIAVDEILDMINKNDVDVWDIGILRYWQEVRQEIEKL